MATTTLRVLLLLVLVTVAFGEHRQGDSLRGALEALQRRQRARTEHPRSLLLYKALPPSEYQDAMMNLYETLPPEYDDEPYILDEDDFDEGLPQKSIIHYLNEEEPNRKLYESKMAHSEKKLREDEQSAFRERVHKYGKEDDNLKQLFAEKEEDKREKKAEAQMENNAEYVVLLDRLWSKYKSRNPNDVDGVVKVYKDRNIKKREYPDDDGWGPVAFKRKRSVREDVYKETEDDAMLKYPLRPNDKYEYAIDGDEKNDDENEDTREELMAFHPLDGGGKIELPTDDVTYEYESINKSPVTKRSTQRLSSGSKKYQNKLIFGTGTDPKIIQDLSKIFGEAVDVVKAPVKRSNNMENSHETKPPQITAAPQNHSHDHNSTNIHKDGIHEHNGHFHSAYPPNVSGQGEVVETEMKLKPISLKKKSIDWSQYFGIDKRKKKSSPFRSESSVESYRKQYDDIFNREMGFHNKMKRSYASNPLDEKEFEIDHVRLRSEGKRNLEGNSKIDNIDRKLAGVESVIVNEALQMASEDGDSKEQQELKEKMLSRLAAAYSLEKMRKALNDFKRTLNAQPEDKVNSEDEITKDKRIPLKKEKTLKETVSSKFIPIANTLSEELESEQGVDAVDVEQGNINGGTDEPYSEGYMGGSGRHRVGAKYKGGTSGKCTVLQRIVQRCRDIDLLSGDQGHLFLQLCSLHQICYLCRQSAQTTCDLIFLSEADTECEGNEGCSRAARISLMVMRDLHEHQSDDMDGECEASTCLGASQTRQDGARAGLKSAQDRK